jgi:hypothetical protein
VWPRRSRGIWFGSLYKLIIRGVAQLVAYLVWDQRVVSSSLATPTSPSEVLLNRMKEGFKFQMSSCAYAEASVQAYGQCLTTIKPDTKVSGFSIRTISENHLCL